MLKRFLGFVLLGALCLGTGFLVYLNPSVVEVRVTPSKSYSAPLALFLFGSFLVGAAAIFVLALVREAQWTLGDRRRRRLETKRAKSRALIATGRDLLWHGRPERAKRVLRRAAGGARDVESLAVLAESALAADRADEARIVLEDGLAVHAENPRLLALLAAVSTRESDWRDATALLERAVVREPQSLRLVAALRDAYVRERRWSEAAQTQDRYLSMLVAPGEIEDERSRLLGLRYELAMDRSEPEESLHDLRDIARTEPTFVPAAVSLGDELRHLGRPQKALRAWIRAASYRPVPALLQRIESLHRELGQAPKTIALYRRLRGRSSSPLLVERMVRALLASGAVDEAAGELEGAALPPGERGALLRGEIERARGNRERALEALHAAFESASVDRLEHACTVCGRGAAGWIPRCPGCGRWDSLEPRDVMPAAPRRSFELLRRLVGR